MGYKTLVCMNIAIIGYGKYAEALAKGLALVGHDVFMGLKNEDVHVTKELLKKYKNISVTTIEDAAAIADIIVLATPIQELRDAAYRMEDVRRKVIIDTTAASLNPVGNASHTANAVRSITGSQHVVKCFNCTGYEDLVNPEVMDDYDMLIAGDSKKAKELTKLLARDLGIVSCYDFGGNDTIPMLNDISKYWVTNHGVDQVSRSVAYKLTR